jgi:isocitrate dehydrogenase (NAD+)
MHHITVIPGDGIGPEIVDAAVRVVDAAGVDVAWEKVAAGQCAVPEFGRPVPDEAIESIKKNGTALKGPLTNIVGEGFPSPNLTLRVKLDLFANVRLARNFEGVQTPFENVDLVVVRENTEDVYVGQEQMVGEGAAVAIKFITRRGSERVIRFAFDYAVNEKREKVTVVLKANILKLTDGMFLRVAREVSKGYPHIRYEEMNVDAQCMELVRKPHEYDVMVMPNLYGDIVADLAGGLVGSVGLSPGGNFGRKIAVFEPAHGSAPKYTGQNKVNPTAMILSASFMLRHIGEIDSAARIEAAVAATIKEGRAVTYDLGGTAGTSGMTDEIIKQMQTAAS